MRRSCSTIIVLAVLIGGCSLFDLDNSEDVVRTYPQAGDHERASFQELAATVRADSSANVPLAPGTYNVEAYVFDIQVCPSNAECFLPDGISISNTFGPDPPANTLRFYTEKPRQFEKGARYVFSLRLEKEEDDQYFVQLVGYSAIET